MPWSPGIDQRHLRAGAPQRQRRPPAEGAGAQGESKPKDDVVDAEFVDVDDKK